MFKSKQGNGFRSTLHTWMHPKQAVLQKEVCCSFAIAFTHRSGAQGIFLNHKSRTGPKNRRRRCIPTTGLGTLHLQV